MRALALALALAVSGCAFGVKHPALTAGIVGGTVALTTCEIGTDFDSHGTCGIVGASGAVGLFAIVGLAILLGGEGHTVLVGDEAVPPPIVREKKTPPPAPDPTPSPAPAPSSASVPAPAPAPTPTPSPSPAP